MPHGYFPIVGTVLAIIVVAAVLASVCRRDFRDRPW
jgi:hypothetical protein